MSYCHVGGKDHCMWLNISDDQYWSWLEGILMVIKGVCWVKENYCNGRMWRVFLRSLSTALQPAITQISISDMAYYEATGELYSNFHLEKNRRWFSVNNVLWCGSSWISWFLIFLILPGLYFVHKIFPLPLFYAFTHRVLSHPYYGDYRGFLPG